MRIGISGAQGVGKTTLLNALAADPMFKDYEKCTEVTRWVKSLGIDINENGTDITQQLISYKHVYNLTMYDKMLTDRTILDCLVYSKWLNRKGLVSQSCLDEIYRVYDNTIMKYDMLFFIKPEFDLVDDGVRSVDVSFRNDIQELFEDVLFETGMGYQDYVIISGTVEERVKQIKNSILWENNDYRL